MEIKTKERKLIYYPIMSDEIIERNLDDFIMFMSSKDFQFRNDICAFFGITNTIYSYDDGQGSDYPHINSHCAEKDNLLKELVEDELIIPKSSKTYRLHPDLVSDDIQDKIDPNATVDKLKEFGWKKFYELNKDNIVKKREFFAKNS